MFPTPVEAQYIRIIPRAWKNNIAIKFDILGCSDTEDYISKIPEKINRNVKVLSAISKLEKGLSQEQKQNFGSTINDLKILLANQKAKTNSDLKLQEAEIDDKLKSMLNAGIMSQKDIENIKKSFNFSSQDDSLFKISAIKELESHLPEKLSSLLETEMSLYKNLLNSDKDASENSNLLHFQEVVIKEKLENLKIQGIVTEDDINQVNQILSNSRKNAKSTNNQIILKEIKDKLPSGQSSIQNALVKFEKLLKKEVIYLNILHF